jgi:hypothetical protein
VRSASLPKGGKAVTSYAEGRTCLVATCETKLSRYNADAVCFAHASNGLVAPRGR